MAKAERDFKKNILLNISAMNITKDHKKISPLKLLTTMIKNVISTWS